MTKGPDSNNLEKALLLALSLISVGLLIAIIYVWYSALGGSKSGTKPGDFLKPEPAASETALPTESSPSSSAQMSKNLSLVISSLAAEAVVATKSVTVTGTASPKANLTITGGMDDVISVTDASGAFSEPVSLNEGQNDLVVTAFDGSGAQVSQTVSVVYMP